MRVVGGELVWCKMTGCPWWPALTFESFEVSPVLVDLQDSFL